MRTLVFLFMVGILTSCNKDDNNATQILKDTQKGIFGSVNVYNEFGDAVGGSGVTVYAELIDSTDTVDKIIRVTPFTTVTDDRGSYQFKDVPSGSYYLTYSREGYSSNRIFGFKHNVAMGDTLNDIVLARPPHASIELSDVSMGPGNRVVYITKKTKLHASYNGEYGAVTRFFFGKTRNVCDTLFEHEWISGGSYGNNGTDHKVVVQKSTDKLFQSGFKEQDSVYLCAYADNVMSYSYKRNDGKMVFPNLSGKSSVVAFKLDTVDVSH